jgi:CheY-like chemotaxis protein
VLVVDDNATSRAILEKILANWGARVTLASGAEEGVLLMKQAHRALQPFHLILLDLRMPGIDGLGFCNLIREKSIFGEAQTILMSPLVDTKDLQQFREAGIANYLTKPVDARELKKTALSLLSLSGNLAAQTSFHVASEVLTASLRILVAEDDAINLVHISTLLKNRRHSVVAARNGIEALEELDRGAFDVVLMDIQMPTMDGLEATRLLREKEARRGGHMPVIALTANAMAGDREKCLSAGIDGYVSKPVKVDDLLKAICAVLASPAACRLTGHDFAANR